MRLTSAATDTSACTANAIRPRAVISAQTLLAASALWRKFTATSAPARASATAIPAPIPRLPPVTRATRFFRFSMGDIIRPSRDGEEFPVPNQPSMSGTEPLTHPDSSSANQSANAHPTPEPNRVASAAFPVHGGKVPLYARRTLAYATNRKTGIGENRDDGKIRGRGCSETNRAATCPILGIWLCPTQR